MKHKTKDFIKLSETVFRIWYFFVSFYLCFHFFLPFYRLKLSLESIIFFIMLLTPTCGICCSSFCRSSYYSTAKWNEHKMFWQFDRDGVHFTNYIDIRPPICLYQAKAILSRNSISSSNQVKYFGLFILNFNYNFNHSDLKAFVELFPYRIRFIFYRITRLYEK